MLIGGILGYVFRAKVEKTIRLGMDRSLSDYGSYRPITEAWDETQQRLQCCGVYDYTVSDSEIISKNLIDLTDIFLFSHRIGKIEYQSHAVKLRHRDSH